MQKLDRETSHFRDRFFIDFSRISDPIFMKKQQKRWRVVRFSCFRYFVFKTDFKGLCGRFGIDFSLILAPKTSVKRIWKPV